MAVPETSVIIRTFNEEKHLPGLLDALGQQTYRDFEIILVDSGSLDRTRDIAAPRVDRLLRIDSHDFTFGYSLNVGIGGSSGRYAAIVSAHTVPVDQGWLGSLVEPLRDERTAMAFGRQLGGASSKFSEIQDLGRVFGPRRQVLRPPQCFANNANSAVRRDLWAQHPFDETLPGLEDIEWAKYWMERGYQLVYDPEAALYHYHEESWRQVRRRYYREGVAARWIGIKGRRHLVNDLGLEIAYTALDLGRAVWPFGDKGPAKMPTLKRGREIVLFRTNKALGTMRGLLDGAAMKKPAARETMFFDRTTQAVVIHGPGRASLDTVEIPEVKPSDVLIRVAYEGVCGTDLEILEGTLGYYKHGRAKYPIVPGHELSGRVVTTGPNVNHLQEGDPVVVECIQSCGRCSECQRSNWIHCAERAELGVIGLNGGYSQYIVVPGRFVHPVPPDLDLRKASLCEPLAVILKALKRLGPSQGALQRFGRCAVVGGGSLGHLCAQVIDLRGIPVTVFDRDPGRRRYFDGSNIGTSDDLSRLSEFDLLVEVTGDPEALDAMLEKSAAGATILLLGLPYTQKQFTFESIVAYDKTVVGSVGSSSEEFDEAIKMLPKLELDEYERCILPLDQFREGWEKFRRREHLKVLLAVDPTLP